MDSFKYASIAHSDLDLLAPVSLATVDRVIDLLELPRDARLVDLACGKGELAVRVLERWGGRGDGFEPSPAFRAAARAEASTRLDPGALTLLDVDPTEHDFEPETYDLALVVNAQPFGDLAETLRRVWAMVRSGGMALVGARFWRADPDPDYLDFLGVGPDTFATHAGNVDLAVREGFTPLYVCAASVEELDHYEGMCNRSIERFLRANPGDGHAAAFRERVRKWRDAHLRWAREGVGFGLYLLLK